MIFGRSNRKQFFFIVDTVIFFLSFGGVYYRYSGFVGVPIEKILFFICLLVLWLVINRNIDTLNVSPCSWMLKLGIDIVKAYSVLTTGSIFIVAILGDFKANYKYILVPLLISCVLSFLVRVIYIKSGRFLGNSSKFVKNIVIVGANQIAERVFDAVLSQYKNGFRISGVIADLDQKNPLDIFPTSYYLGPVERLYDILQAENIHEVIVALPMRDEAQILLVTDICEYEGVRCKIVPDYYRLIKSKLVLEELGGVPLVSVRHEPLESLLNRFFKRTFDIIFSSLVLVLLFPVFLTIGLMIKITSPGDAFFRQKRVGINNKEFMMYKFRTMTTQTQKNSDTVWTTKNDSRVTPLGKILRTTNLDELPQFLNVLKGDMSVVGPRPEREFFVNQFKDKIPSYKVRHMVKAGVTGWAQVNGWRGDTSIEQRIVCDLYYIENWSLGLDVKIIWLTLFGSNTNKNAY